MINHPDTKWFVAKDVNELLGVKPGLLFYWQRTWNILKPAIKAKDGSRKDKYSFSNLLDIALINELNQFGLDSNRIEKILGPYSEIKNSPDKKRRKIWNYFKKNRTSEKDWDSENGEYVIPGFDNAGCLLLIFKHDGKYIAHINTNSKILEFIQDFNLDKSRYKDSRSILIIDLLKIVRDLEEKTGERL